MVQGVQRTLQSAGGHWMISLPGIRMLTCLLVDQCLDGFCSPVRYGVPAMARETRNSAKRERREAARPM